MSMWNKFIEKIYLEEYNKNKKYTWSKAINDAISRKKEFTNLNPPNKKPKFLLC
jgi:hypothetical protein